MSNLKVGQLRRWTIPVHPIFGRHDADGMIFRVASLDETDGPMAEGKYVSGRVPWCRTEPEWMAANSVVIEDAP